MEEFAITIPNDSGQAQAVQERIVEAMEKLQYTMRDVFSMRLALEEALANAIKHGNALDPEKKVFISCQVSSEKTRVEIEDEGPGFHPEEVPDPTADENLERPCGRGLMLMKSYMSLIEFNESGNRVVMEKARTVES